MKADLLLRSNAIFTALESEPFSGSIAVCANKIISVTKTDGREFIGPDTQILELQDRLICPGFTDSHCFFTGYLLSVSGMDFGHCSTEEEVLSLLHDKNHFPENVSLILGRNISPDFTSLTCEKLDRLFPATPVILFQKDTDSCFMNSPAAETFQFDPETCWSESYWRLLRHVLSDKKQSLPVFQKYLSFMNQRGITSVKEMGFDDFWGFTDVLAELEKSSSLNVRVSFMSQPVGAPMDLKYGKEMREKFTGPFVHFSGYNQMTDGSISQMEGEMKLPYQKETITCRKKIDWELLQKDTIAADQNGFRFSLHAQGDGAICKTINIFDKCLKKADGTLQNRHAITDLECADPADFKKMAELGIVGEIYPQIMSIANRTDKVSMITEYIGMDRGRHYWNRRAMLDSGLILACATDLPLLFDNIPESIYHSVGGYFPEGGEPFLPENTISIAELLKAWSIGGQYDLGFDHELGSLEAGKTADIAVFDRNLFETPLQKIRDVQIDLTIVDGRIVYNRHNTFFPK